MDDRNKATNAANSDTGITETDLAQDRMGNNRLQGDDQESVHNQRQAVPDVKTKAEGVVESFENMDPETRAKRANGG